MPKLSPEQATATLPSKTVWVGASAGTGKTHVLTARVLRLMVRGTPPGNIICLTFTKAAAAEMKTRIFKELGQWAVMEDIALIEALVERIDERATQDIIARARRLFAEVLDLPGGLKIMTFHSFCQSLLGRFPLEAALAPGFEALDDQLAAILKLEARDKVLKNFKGAASLKAVAERVSEDDFDRIMHSLMTEGMTVRRLHERYGAQGLRAAMLRHFGLNSEATTHQIKAKAAAEDACNLSGLRALYRVFESGTVTEQKLAAMMQDFLLAHSAEERVPLLDRYMEAFLTQTSSPRKNIPTKGTAKKAPETIDIYADEQDRLMRVKQQMLTLEMVEATCALLTLGFDQINAYESLKHSRGLVDFDDMINSTVSLLRGHAAAPWILYKMDGGIDHILVDEAQDTNSAQWQVVESLSEEFFAGLGARAGAEKSQSDEEMVPRTIFAVGDVKQSIYSFQSADPKEFVAARERIFGRAEGAGADFAAVPLNTSYRSGGAVLALVDSVFKKGGPAYAGLTFDQEEIEHNFARRGHGGSVTLWPLVSEDDTGADSDPEDSWQPPVHQQEMRDAERQTALKIADHIQAQIKGNMLLQSKNRPITPGDILVIVRKRSSFVEQLTRALKARDIPVSGRDRLMLTSEQPVMDLLSLMRFVLQPGDDLSCGEVLTGPLVGLSQEELFSLAYNRGKSSLWQRLQAARHSSAALKTAYDFLTRCLNKADRGTPFDFLMTVLNDFGGRKKLMARLGSEINDPLDELLEEALDYERSHSPSLQTFLYGFELSDVTIKRDMEEAGNTVRIMTAHGSKGLQAPIVYLPDTTSLPEVGRDTALITEEGESHDWLYWTSGIKNLAHLDTLKDRHKDKMLAEYRRLLYVAMTRAEDHLYVTGWQKKRQVSEDCWYHLIRQGFEALEGAWSESGADGETLMYQVDHTAFVEAPPRESAQADNVPLPDFFHQPAPLEASPSRPLTPSRPDQEEPPARSPLMRLMDSPYQRGNLIHSLLEWLPDLPLAAREEATRTYLAKPAHGLSPEQQETFCREVMAVLTHSEAHNLFGPDSRAEVPIAGVLPDGTAISAQIDRLVITDDCIWIVDYKTNQPPPDSVDKVPHIYVKQLALYRQTLAAIYPGRVIKSFLLWTDSLTLMDLSTTGDN